MVILRCVGDENDLHRVCAMVNYNKLILLSVGVFLRKKHCVCFEEIAVIIIGLSGFDDKPFHKVIVLRLLLSVNYKLRGIFLHLLTIQCV